MDERLCFVAPLLEGRADSLVCREFGISRKIGDKIFARQHRSLRRPVRSANQLQEQMETAASPSTRIRLKGAPSSKRTQDFHDSHIHKPVRACLASRSHKRAAQVRASLLSRRRWLSIPS
jgi:hypothetical protein